MSEKDKMLMSEYGITSTFKKVYRYKDYRYDRLSDALSYARTDISLSGEDVKQETPVLPDQKLAPLARNSSYCR